MLSLRERHRRFKYYGAASMSGDDVESDRIGTIENDAEGDPECTSLIRDLPDFDYRESGKYDESYPEWSYIRNSDIDPQPACPFYNGRIPAEIRTLIFQYVFTDTASRLAPPVHPYADVRQDHQPVACPDLPGEPPSEPFWKKIFGYAYFRPDGINCNDYWYYVPTELLRTCRRIYFEARTLPLLQTEFPFRCYERRGGSVHCEIAEDFARHRRQGSSLHGRYRVDLIRRVRVYMQQAWLERRGFLGFHDVVVDYKSFERVTDLRLTLRRRDWRDWERGAALCINPYRAGPPGLPEMEEDMALTQVGGIPPFMDSRAWGLAFRAMPNLETLVMDFETAASHRAELERIVGWARTWRFPLDEDWELSAKGHRVERMSWWGTWNNWSDGCPGCGQPTSAERQDSDCSYCDDRRRLLKHGLGPRMYVWTVTWKAEQTDSVPIGR